MPTALASGSAFARVVRAVGGRVRVLVVRASVAALPIVAVSAVGCSSVGGSAVRTGPVQFPSYDGPVAVYAMGQPPPGAIDLGVVEVHALQSEGTVDVLVPQFVRKVAEIGGDVAVIEGIRARFDLVGRPRLETFYYACGMGATCAGTRMYNTTEEQVLVSVFGHAYRAASANAPAPPAPLTEPAPPAEPAPPDVTDEEPSPPEPAPSLTPSSASRTSPPARAAKDSAG